MNNDDKRIREFAYQIWESEGKPEGQEARHWEMAHTLAQAEALAPKKAAASKAKPKAAPASSVKRSDSFSSTPRLGEASMPPVSRSLFTATVCAPALPAHDSRARSISIGMYFLLLNFFVPVINLSV